MTGFLGSPSKLSQRSRLPAASILDNPLMRLIAPQIQAQTLALHPQMQPQPQPTGAGQANAAQVNATPSGKTSAPSRTFMGDVGKAFDDANDTLNPLKHPVLANAPHLGQIMAGARLVGGVIDAAGAAAGRNLYNLNPRTYSDGAWNLARLATTVGPNPNRPAILNQPGLLQIPWVSPLQNIPAPMLKREDAETHGEIAANVASLIPLGPEEAIADSARLAAPTLTELGGDAARTLLRPVNNFVGEATRTLSKTHKPFHFLDPAKEGDRLLAGGMRKDLAAPETVIANQNAWQGTGASGPSLIDVSRTLPNVGTNTQRLVRDQ